MVDIALCLNHGCPRAKECYRHEAKPSELRQAYADFHHEDCEHFLPIMMRQFSASYVSDAIHPKCHFGVFYQ